MYDLYFPYHGLHFSFSKLDLFLEMFSCFNKLFQTEKKKKPEEAGAAGYLGFPGLDHMVMETLQLVLCSAWDRGGCAEGQPSLYFFCLFVF